MTPSEMREIMRSRHPMQDGKSPLSTRNAFQASLVLGLLMVAGTFLLRGFS
ncbi:MAG: hypothetical protein V4564_07595 [Pseudomonadota bacterium]